MELELGSLDCMTVKNIHVNILIRIYFCRTSEKLFRSACVAASTESMLLINSPIWGDTVDCFGGGLSTYQNVWLIGCFILNVPNNFCTHVLKVHCKLSTLCKITSRLCFGNRCTVFRWNTILNVHYMEISFSHEFE